MNKLKSKAQQIAEELYFKITDEKLQPGARIPSERSLAAELNCSRTSLREAIKLLIAKDVLIVKRGSGIYVNNVNDEKIFCYEDLKNKSVSLTMGYEFRLIYEPDVARLAAQRATDEEIEAILKCADEILNLTNLKKNFISKDKEFHQLIARASHNDIVLKLTTFIDSLIQESITFSRLSGGEELNLKNASEGHMEIAKFIAARDEMGAYIAMRLHLVRNKEFIDKVYNL